MMKSNGEDVGNPEVKYLGPPDYEIQRFQGYGYGRPNRSPQFVVLMDDSDGTAKMFKRNMVHSDGRAERWLVAEVKGVRLYCTGEQMYILTDKDVYSSKDLVNKLADGEFDAIPR